MDLTKDEEIEIAAILEVPTSRYDELSIELRFLALGLGVPDPPPKPPGRPRKLSFRQQLEVRLRWTEIRKALARYGRSTARPELRRVLKEIRQPKNALPWRFAELSRKADQTGRFSSTEILPPDETLPAIDKIVAGELDIHERQVRRIRSDPRMQPFTAGEPWLERDF